MNTFWLLSHGRCLCQWTIFSTPHSRGTRAIAAALTLLHEKYCNVRILYLRIHLFLQENRARVSDDRTLAPLSNEHFCRGTNPPW